MAIRISEVRLLVVEGNDEEFFLRALLKHWGLSGFQIHNAKGADNLADALLALTDVEGFGAVRCCALLRDADQDAAAAFASCAGAIERAGLLPPAASGEFSVASPCVGVFVLPDGKRPGMLEDLLLATVAAHPALGCVDGFLQCLRHALAEDAQPGNPAKARAKAFLAAMPKVVPHVGLAAQQGYWDLSSSALDGFKLFLQQMARY